MNIIVVGGSLAGLFVGLSLKRLGHYVHILERNSLPLFQGNGAGIFAGEETRLFMKKFDRSERDLTISPTFLHYLDVYGNEIHRENTDHQATSWDLLYHILRANFDGIKNAYCQLPDDTGEKVAYDYDANVTNMEVDDDSVTIFYEQKNEKKSIKGDILIAADGASSRIRTLIDLTIERNYVGYVVWRGTVPESDISESLTSTFIDGVTFFHASGIQFACYTIPGQNGALDQGLRLINWVWYCNYADPSEILTDCHGRKHHWTVPRGKVAHKVWEDLKQYANSNLPPQFIELVNATQVPFVQAVSDVLATQACYYNGRVVLVGDALAGFRPHTASATSQAAFHGLQLWDKMQSWSDWLKNRSSYEEIVMKFARQGVEHGQKLGHASQFEDYEVGGKIKMGYMTTNEDRSVSEGSE
ncbi:unnamed protein product [Adineta ricciae]|uniref:2,6-dihydroxypyridine 3-monooxygenase substrate binding domain-containing protein n=1 Tax=Adineta ricciae TaxID=249248 RepID=A0A814D7T4_ADIRI|nr:unnamed protein product [Adineta ricciae]CAF1376521.1 unnamed protein product [Adineta ricciae]